MKRFLPLFLVFFLIVSCAGFQGNRQPDENPFATGKPWICSSVDGVVTESTPTNIKDDFALYTGKDWILENSLKEGEFAIGPMFDITYLRDNDLVQILSTAAPENDQEKLALDLFELMCDWDKRNEIGVAPLKAIVDQVEQIDSLEKLSEYFINTPFTRQLLTLFCTEVTISDEDNTKYDLYIDFPYLTLGDSSEYSELSDLGKVYDKAFSTLSRKLLMKLGYTEEEAEEKYANCQAFERLIAPSVLPRGSAYADDYIITKDQITTLCGDYPVMQILEKSAGFSDLEYIVCVYGEAFPAKLGEIYTEKNLQLIKDYLIVQGSMGDSLYFDRDCYNWNIESTAMLNGGEPDYSYEPVFASFITNHLAWPVSRLYCRLKSSKQDKERISELVEKIQKTYEEIINEASFLSSDTKQKAIEKLRLIDKKILFPNDNEWDLYARNGLQIKSSEDGGSLYEAISTIREYEIGLTNQKLKSEVDRSLWIIEPTTDNCYYIPRINSIYITACFAQGEMYNSSMSDEELLSSLGMCIAHEISHAFDPIGAQYDKDGNHSQWWTQEEVDGLNRMNERIADYLSSITIWGDVHLNGDIASGEECADMGAMKCILRIASKIKDFDYDAFFKYFAHKWSSIVTPELMMFYLSDPHVPGYARINTILQQFDEFLDFYDINPGDGMYLAPEDRIKIW